MVKVTTPPSASETLAVAMEKVVALMVSLTVAVAVAPR